MDFGKGLRFVGPGLKGRPPHHKVGGEGMISRLGKVIWRGWGRRSGWKKMGLKKKGKTGQNEAMP